MTRYFCYQVYGLHLRSTLPMPGLAASAGAGADVTIEFAGAVHRGTGIVDAAPDYQDGVETVWHVDSETWSVCYGDPNANYVTVTIGQAGRQIVIGWTDRQIMTEAVPLVLAPILLGSILGAALHLRGLPCLHASTVAIDGGAVLLLGASGAGKSTLAAAMVRQGHALLADDIAALVFRRDGAWAPPGPPYMRMWPDTLQALGWRPDTLPTVWADAAVLDAKRVLDLSAQPSTYPPVAAPLAAIYVLEPRRSGNQPPLVAPIPPRQAALALMQNVYVARWLDPRCRARAFQACARLAETVPVRRIAAGNNLADVPQVARTLAADVASLQLRSAGPV
jgi:hypothetical protein